MNRQVTLALLGLLTLGAAAAVRTDAYSVFISGDTLGYLSPCGCTYPMSGGIRRRAEAIDKTGKVLFLDNGALTKDLGRQSEMKAETLAQSLAAAGVDAINLTSLDAQLGKGSVLSVARLSGNKLISSHFPAENSFSVPQWAAEGPFLIGGASTRAAAIKASLGLDLLPLEEALQAFTGEAFQQEKTPILLLEGSLEQARAVARDFPTLKLVVYRTTGDPPVAPEREGETSLLTPGDRGRNLLKLTSDGSEFQGYRPINLGPEHKDHADVSRLYASYLKRVNDSDLLEQLPRLEGEAFAGTKKCISCHATPGKIWKSSAHAHALATLEKEGHSRDPDCVSCHVVRLQLTTGFKSREKTPDLADVGCESCHGAGAKHAQKPMKVKLDKVGAESCVSCHTTENSPRFDFASYWKKIKH